MPTSCPECSATGLSPRLLEIVLAVDTDGTRSIAGARAAYVRGDIEIEEFERRIDRMLHA